MPHPNLPPAVREAFKKLREGSRSFVYLKVVHDHYYVYRQTSVWDKAAKRVRSISEYLGGIDRHGAFRPKRGHEHDAQPGTGIDGRAPAGQQPHPTDIEAALLKALSMNARADLAHFARGMGIKPASLYYKVKQLESRYGIRYVTEVDLSKLGYVYHLALVKFEGRKPTPEDVRSAAEDDGRIQLVMSVSGMYDLVIVFVAKDSSDASDLIYTLRSKPQLTRITSRWQFTPLDVSYGYIPVRERFFDLIKKSVWRRAQERPRRQPGQVTQREYDVLRELCIDGASEFTAIDSKYGFDGGTSQYTYHRLMERGVIRRVTIAMERMPLQYHAIILMSILNNALYRPSKERVLEVITGNAGIPSNRFSATGNLGSPEGILFLMPVGERERLDSIEAEMAAKISGAEFSSMVVVNVVLGSTCDRLFDNSHSSQYSELVEKYGWKPAGSAGHGNAAGG